MGRLSGGSLRVSRDPLILRAKRKRQHALFTSKWQDWKTPRELYEKLNAEFQFNFDPCPPNRTIRSYGSLQSVLDGLSQNWGTRNFINPPYKEVSKWVAKAYRESLKGKLCVLLTASRTDTRWFHEFALPHAREIRFIRGRLKFIDPRTNEEGCPAPFPSVIIIFDGREPL